MAAYWLQILYLVWWQEYRESGKPPQRVTKVDDYIWTVNRMFMCAIHAENLHISHRSSNAADNFLPCTLYRLSLSFVHSMHIPCMSCKWIEKLSIPMRVWRDLKTRIITIAKYRMPKRSWRRLITISVFVTMRCARCMHVNFTTVFHVKRKLYRMQSNTYQTTHTNITITRKKKRKKQWERKIKSCSFAN